MHLTVQAPAKVNLCLRVLGRRPDGFHELATLMQPLDLCDTLHLSLGGPGLSLSCNQSQLEADNLVLRAARGFFAALGQAARAYFILQKRIPVAAGLGGGSSDAAAALLALNALHGQALAPEELVGLAASLGVDVPFFLGGATALCSGVGEVVRPWPEFPLLDYVLVNPGFPLPTAGVYQEFDLQWTNAAGRTKINRPPGDYSPGLAFLVNDLEQVALRAHPVLGRIKKALAGCGALGCLMSGSGPTVFGVFADAAQAGRAARRIRREGRWWVRACRGVAA